MPKAGVIRAGVRGRVAETLIKNAVARGGLGSIVLSREGTRADTGGIVPLRYKSASRHKTKLAKDGVKGPL